MNGSAVDQFGEKKRHVCPQSTATHPSDRWETLYVCAFLARFTRGKIEGLHSPMEYAKSIMSSSTLANTSTSVLAWRTRSCSQFQIRS
jgi:hypothetical protein